MANISRPGSAYERLQKIVSVSKAREVYEISYIFSRLNSWAKVTDSQRATWIRWSYESRNRHSILDSCKWSHLPANEVSLLEDCQDLSPFSRMSTVAIWSMITLKHGCPIYGELTLARAQYACHVNTRNLMIVPCARHWTRSRKTSC